MATELLTRNAEGLMDTRKPKDPRKHAKWLLVASGKGGNGKTTSSLNLGVVAAHVGLNVCLVDLDSQRSLSRWHDRRPADAPELKLWQGRLVDAKRAIQEIDEVEVLDLVIVDTPPTVDEHLSAMDALIRRSSFVLVPTTQGTVDLDSVVEWMTYLRRFDVRAAFVINRAQRTYGTYQKAKKRLNRAGPLCPMDIRQLEDIQATHDLGVGVKEMSKSRAIEDYEGVWDYLCAELEIVSA
jgi:chromosome partitioning protein